MPSSDVPDDRLPDIPDDGVPQDLPDDIRPFRAGEQVRLEDPKGRHHLVTLEPGRTFHTHRGGVALDELIGKPEGVVVTSSGGVPYLALRPLWSDYVLAMPRGATIVYPKDAGQILIAADIFPGAHVIEAGAGSGSLTCALLRAVGPTGRVTSYERRDDFALIARRNVERFFGESPSTWHLVVGDVAEAPTEPRADRIVLDLLAPWDCLPWAAATLRPGGVLCCYVATTTQLGRLVETVRAHGGFTEPISSETLVRTWHIEGLSIRPDHRMVGHTGFLMTTRRLAPGVTAPRRRRRPAPGAYGEDYTGPRPDAPSLTSEPSPAPTSPAPRASTPAENESCGHEADPKLAGRRTDDAVRPEQTAPEND
ncbi:tRNA (adenine-58-N(1)-) methyltransferase [Thermasporomyces composti]|jgi:tRNA (adenine57-N1/adenine58-N1)-methyltransferase|uniref:tRNA (Adenine-58-N(1)-) methyltransferase n=1 Tax=Thermasporomyces composti TaxID=696763 RepID=A0A3D9VCD0_THECX|nr:tRNA (adenine-N1)-methyltransferase [Thermasporomyces composti]REF38353.1 tRNA (adenine-58-N(1)-) methyltransferase [Thermasporomyces composti]